MKADFLDAHHRHWADAELLFKSSRWPNADHLYGLSVECGLKCLMIKFGMSINATTGSPVDKDDRVHANTAWMRYESYRSGRLQGASYALATINPFSDWHVSQRYAHRAQFDPERVNQHRTGADAVRALVNKSSLAGLL